MGKTFTLLTLLLTSLCSGIKLYLHSQNKHVFPSCIIYYSRLAHDFFSPGGSKNGCFSRNKMHFMTCQQKVVYYATRENKCFSRAAYYFFLLGGQKMDLFARHGAIKSTLLPSSRKIYLFIPIDAAAISQYIKKTWEIYHFALAKQTFKEAFLTHK